MNKPNKSLLTILFLCAVFSHPFAQERSFDELEEADIQVYKRVDDTDLKLNIIYPDDYQKGKRYPAIVFFYGGGWKNGNVHQFEHQCHYFASKGLVAIAANYRVSARNHSTPFDAVEDAKSAMRYIRGNAKKLGVKKGKIVAAGGSAGGHLAASVAMIPGYSASNENKSVRTRPGALVLFNPVINTMPEGFGYNQIGENQESISPAHHVVAKLPPTLIFHGLEDKTVPFDNIVDFQNKMTSVGNTCYVVPFREMGHGFFNYGINDNRCYELTIEKTESFLRELKYIK
jgi:acetyl esterase/lipase